MATKESNTRSFILRIDSETMEALERWAEDEFRSTNGQLQWIITEALRRSGRKPRPRRNADTQKRSAKAPIETEDNSAED